MTDRNSTIQELSKQGENNLPVTDTCSFIAKAKRVHKNKYSYIDTIYTKSSNRLIVMCSKHGAFEPTANNHLRGSGCKKCADDARKMTVAEFKKRAREIHTIDYDYSKVDISGSKKVVLIGCPLHGFFKQRVVNHLNGKGCATCGMSSGGWTRTSFQSACTRNNSSGLGILYILKCKNSSEVFYKIGITSRSVKKRFDYKKLMPYDFEVEYIVKQKGLYIYNLEQKLKKVLANYKYIPEIKFGGHLTECFATIKPIDRLLKQLTSTDQLQLIA